MDKRKGGSDVKGKKNCADRMKGMMSLVLSVLIILIWAFYGIIKIIISIMNYLIGVVINNIVLKWNIM